MKRRTPSEQKPNDAKRPRRKMTESGGIRWLLDRTTLQDLSMMERTFNVETCRPNTPLKDALKLLADNRIVSIPVMTDKEQDGQGAFLGMFQAFNFVKHIVNHTDEVGTDKTTHDLPRKSRWERMVELGKSLEDRPVVEFLDKTEPKKSGVFWAQWRATEGVFDSSKTVEDDDTAITTKKTLKNTSLFDGIEAFLRPGWKHCHRMAVFEDDTHQTIKTIISTSDIIRFLAYNASTVCDFASSSLQELGLTGQKVHCVRAKTPAVDAFSKMIATQVTSLPVIDNAGRVVTNVSYSDLQGFLPQDFPLLEMPVETFVQARRKHFTPKQALLSWTAFPYKQADAVTVSENSTVKEVLFKLVHYGIHRVYIMKETNIVGVVSHSDIFRLLSRLE